MVRVQWVRAIAIAAGTALLAGCIELDADITLNSDAEATGTYEVTMAKAVASLMGVTSADDLKRSLLENAEVDLPVGNSVDVRDTETSYIMTVELKDIALDDPEFGASVLSNGNIRFNFKNEGSDTGSENLDLGIDAGSIKVKIKFPGPIIDTGAMMVKVSDREALLEIPLDQSVDTYVVSEPGSRSDSGPDDSTKGGSNQGAGGGIPGSVLGASTAAVLLLVFFIVRQRRRKIASDSANDGVTPPTA